MDSLAGHFLIASPAILDPNFHRAVVFVTAHSEEGAVGLILNRRSDATVGDAVPQLYLGFPGAPGQPLRALRGMSRVTLQAGESRKIHFNLDARDLSSVTMEGDRVVAPGVYRITVGEGQPGTGAAMAAAQVTITGNAALPQ